MGGSVARTELLTQTKLALGDSHTMEVVCRPGAAALTLRSSRNEVLLSFEIAITPAGAVVRGQAAALEIEASRVATRCDEFLVEARDRIDLRSSGSIVQQASGSVRLAAADVGVEASPGGVRVRANDDVQLLGEQVLLNCDRPSPMPAWTATPASPPALLPRQNESGDAPLIREITENADLDAAR